MFFPRRGRCRVSQRDIPIKWIVEGIGPRYRRFLLFFLTYATLLRDNSSNLFTSVFEDTALRVIVLPLAVRKKLAAIGDHHAVAFWVLLPVDPDLEVDGAHDAVTKHLVNDLLHGGPVHLSDFVEPVD